MRKAAFGGREDQNFRVELDENSWFRWMTKEKLRVKLDESGWFWRTEKSKLRG
jgi:hypothetical protein